MYIMLRAIGKFLNCVKCRKKAAKVPPEKETDITLNKEQMLVISLDGIN